MPAAPNLATLLDIATPVEDAVKLLCEKPPRLIDAFTARETGDLPGQRVEVVFSLGKWTGRWGVDRQGVMQHSAWSYTLELHLWTKREAATARAAHGTLRGKLSAKLIAAVRNPDFLRYHTIASLDEQSGTEQIRQTDDLDGSTITFTGLVCIRSDAWPVK